MAKSSCEKNYLVYFICYPKRIYKKKSARFIYENGPDKLIDGKCRICKLFKSKKILI